MSQFSSIVINRSIEIYEMVLKASLFYNIISMKIDILKSINFIYIQIALLILLKLLVSVFLSFLDKIFII